MRLCRALCSTNGVLFFQIPSVLVRLFLGSNGLMDAVLTADSVNLEAKTPLDWSWSCRLKLTQHSIWRYSIYHCLPLQVISF